MVVTIDNKKGEILVSAISRVVNNRVEPLFVARGTKQAN